MGIICLCPNGHRTKLKDRFAGLRVRCPQCGEKFRVAPHDNQTRERASAISPSSPSANKVEFDSPLVTMDRTHNTWLLNPTQLYNRIQILSRQYLMRTPASYGGLPHPVVNRVTQWKARNYSLCCQPQRLKQTCMFGALIGLSGNQ